LNYGDLRAGQQRKIHRRLLVVATKQHIAPEQACVWLAAEPFESNWAKKFGVDVEKLLVINPDCAEQVIDVCEEFMGADDCGLVVLDNLAAMITKKELENSAEIDDSGGSGRVGKKLFNTVMEAQKKAAEKGRAATFVFTNQMRAKIGVDGRELTSFGGPFPKHASVLRLRLYAKDIVDKTVNPGLPARKEVRVAIEKAKIPVAAQGCVFEIAMLNQPGLQIGQVKDNWKVLPPAFPQ
jgi:recombination protein RecA